jgi:aspartate/methionine/tyrosine aminotransferase
MMFLSYPNNPTSAIATDEYFDRAIAFAREHDLLIIHDNAYSEIGIDGYKPPSFLERPGAKDVAIELFSCSKSYNMTGWRVAFAAGNAGDQGARHREVQHRLRRLHRGAGRRHRGDAGTAGLGRRALRALPASPRPRHARRWTRSA